MAFDRFNDRQAGAPIKGTPWEDGGITWTPNNTRWVANGTGGAYAGSDAGGGLANYQNPPQFRGAAVNFSVAPGLPGYAPAATIVIDGDGPVDYAYYPAKGVRFRVGAYGTLYVFDYATGTEWNVAAPVGVGEYILEASRTPTTGDREYKGTLYNAANGVRGSVVGTITVTIATAPATGDRRVVMEIDPTPGIITVLGVETVPLNFVAAPTGNVTTQTDPDGQRVRFTGTTTNATSGRYTLTATSGGVTVSDQPFSVSNNAFDFEVADIEPGSYSPTLTVTGEGGTTNVSGTKAFTIGGVTGGGDLPPVQTDTTAPTVTGAAVSSGAPGVVVLTSSEPLDTNNVPAASAFTVTGHIVSAVTIQGSAINLTVTPNFANGETPRTVAYAQPASNSARDVAGNLLASFAGQAIANNVAAPISTVTGVTINPTVATIAGGAAQQFTGSVQGTNSPSQGLTWTRNPALGSVSASGLYTAPAATNVAQTITVTATSQQDPNFAASAVVTVPAAAPAGTNFTRSLARTIRVKPAPLGFEGGPFWDLSNKRKPVGSIDKDATIDVSFDLTDMLADIADTVKKIDFDLAGLTSVGGYFTGGVATVFVSNAVPLTGNGNPTITCKVTTNSTPPRIEDWTVELKLEEH